MNEYSSNRKLVDIFAIVVSALVLVGALLLIFVDSISDQLGALVLKANFSDYPNAYPMGKIIGFGLLPFTPLLVLYLLDLIFPNIEYSISGVIAGFFSVGLVVLFYFVAKKYFGMFVRDDEWFYNLGHIYIWYAYPLVSALEIYGFWWVEDHLDGRPVLYCMFAIAVVPVTLVGLPVLIGLIGFLTIVALIVGFILLVVYIFMSAAGGSSSSSSSSSDEEYWELDDGTKLTHDYSNYYKDENGSRWISDDGGSTFYKDE